MLQGLSLELGEGQILGLLGRNGVGKTTLVNSIVGFNRPRRGRIVFKGEDITGVSSFETVRRGMGLVPQGRRVFASLTVEENLNVARPKEGWTLKRVYELFPRLEERRRQRAKTLSGGEQQMLAIARGLMTNPDCLIMDEPSEGLAPIIIQTVWQAVSKLKAQGLSILLVEQNAALALQLVDYVHVISKGRVVYSGTPKELWADDAVKSALPRHLKSVNLDASPQSREAQEALVGPYFAGKEVDHPLERIEAEGLRHRRAQVGVGVDVVEHEAAVARLEILDAADVELAGRDDPLAPGDGLRRHFVIGIELRRGRCNGPQGFADGRFRPLPDCTPATGRG